MSANRDDIVVRIAGDLADIQKSLRDLRRQTKDAGNQAKRSQRDWADLGRGLDGLKSKVAGLVGAYISFRSVTALLGTVVRNTIAQEQATAQLEARLRSTENVIGLTVEQLQKMAAAYQDVTTYGDEQIMSAQAVLLTYTQIGQETFPRATEAALDFAAAMGTDVARAAETVGKALGTPTKAAAALADQGFVFTGQQRELIRSLEESGRLAEAQAIILEELELAYGGAARAARDTLGGALAGLKNAFGDLLEAPSGNLPGAKAALEDLVAVLQDPATREAFHALTTGVIAASSGVAVLTVELSKLFGLVDRTSAQYLVRELDKVEKAIARIDERSARGQAGWIRRRIDQNHRAELEVRREELERAIRREEMRMSFAERRAALAGDAATSPAAVPPPSDARVDLRQLQSQLAGAGILLKDELKRLGDELDREFGENLKRFDEYYRRRAELETQSIDQQLEQQRNALQLVEEEIRLADERGDSIATHEANRAKLIAEITVLERQRGDVAAKAARDQAAAEKALADQLAGVALRLRELQGDTVGARGEQLEREFADLIARLQIEGDAEGVALVQRLINVEMARVRLEDLEGEYSRALERMAREERRIELAAQTGAITERDARRQIADLYRETAAEVEALIPLMAELGAATGDPEAIARVEELRLEIEELRASAEQASNEMAEQLQRAGTDAFSEWVSGAKSASEAWDGFVDNIRKRAADLLADQVIQGLVSALSGLGGGGGFFANFGKGFKGAGVFHEGGIVGRPARTRMVPALAFAEAPRLHGGGGFGLAPDERAAILQTGEEVLSRRDPRNRLNGGGGITINVATPDARTAVRESAAQIGAQFATALARARNRNG